MVTKKEKRELRKKEKLERFEASKSNLLVKVQIEKDPQFANLPNTEQNPKIAPQIAHKVSRSGKSIKVRHSTSRWGQLVTWCDTKKDTEGNWTWGEPRQWNPDEWNGVILPGFQEFEKLTWQEIDAAGSGSSHKMHHSQELSEIIREAQDRWCDVGLEEFETLFRFRLGGTRRAWGFIVQAHFHFVWWERYHKIYPTN